MCSRCNPDVPKRKDQWPSLVPYILCILYMHCTVKPSLPLQRSALTLNVYGVSTRTSVVQWKTACTSCCIRGPTSTT